MSVTATARQRVHYPTAHEIRTAVRNVSGDDFETTWNDLCRECSVSPTAGTYTVEEVDWLAATLRLRPGLLRVVGHSLAIRINTYRTLSRVAA